MDELGKPEPLDYAGPGSDQSPIDDTPFGQFPIDSLCVFGLIPPLFGYVIWGLFLVFRGKIIPSTLPSFFLMLLIFTFLCSVLNFFSTVQMILGIRRMKRWWHAFALVAGSTWLLLTCCVTGSLFMR